MQFIDENNQIFSNSQICILYLICALEQKIITDDGYQYDLCTIDVSYMLLMEMSKSKSPKNYLD